MEAVLLVRRNNIRTTDVMKDALEISFIKISGVVLTQLSLTLHCSSRTFYYQNCIHTSTKASDLRPKDPHSKFAAE